MDDYAKTIGEGFKESKNRKRLHSNNYNTNVNQRFGNTNDNLL
jgi:hypothetical protein